MNEQELVVLTSWNKLSEIHPKEGALCDWWCITELFSDKGRGRFGYLSTLLNSETGEPSAVFFDNKGAFIGDQENIYWRESDE